MPGSPGVPQHGHSRGGEQGLHQSLLLRYSACFSSVYTSVAEPEPLEPPLLGRLRSRSRFFCWSEPGAGVALFKAAPAASFRQAKKKGLVLVSNMTLRAV